MGKKQILHLSGWHHVVVFKTKVLHFKFENTPMKDTNGKKKFKKLLRFLFVDKRELFAMKLCLEQFNLVFFAADQSAWLVLNQPRQGGFWRNMRYFLYSTVKESTSFKGNFCTYKGFMDVFYILTLAWKKNQKMCIWNSFFCHALSRFNLGERIQDPVGVIRKLLFRIDLWVFQ